MSSDENGRARYQCPPAGHGRTVAEEQHHLVGELREHARKAEAERKSTEVAARLAEGQRLLEDMRRWMDAGSETLDAELLRQGRDLRSPQELAGASCGLGDYEGGLSGKVGVSMKDDPRLGQAAGPTAYRAPNKMFTRIEVLAVLNGINACDGRFHEAITAFERME